MVYVPQCAIAKDYLHKPKTNLHELNSESVLRHAVDGCPCVDHSNSRYVLSHLTLTAVKQFATLLLSLSSTHSSLQDALSIAR